MKRRLAQLADAQAEITRSSRRRLSTRLRHGVFGLKGHAIIERTEVSPDALALVVELVFADRNEQRRLDLIRSGAGWRIARSTHAGETVPAVPYGTPVDAS